MKASNILAAAGNNRLLQLGKVTLIPNWNMKHERRSTELNLYHLLYKADIGLGSDTLPRQPRECTPVETTSWVFEAGSDGCGDMSILAPCNSGTSPRPLGVGS